MRDYVGCPVCSWVSTFEVGDKKDLAKARARARYHFKKHLDTEGRFTK